MTRRMRILLRKRLFRNAAINAVITLPEKRLGLTENRGKPDDFPHDTSNVLRLATLCFLETSGSC